MGGGILCGAGRYAMKIMERLEGSQFEFRLVTLKEGPLAAEADRRGLVVDVLGKRRTADPICILKIIRLLRTRGVDLIHTHTSNGNLYGIVASWFCARCRPVATLHAYYQDVNEEAIPLRALLYPGYRLDLLLLRRACRIVAVSRSIRDRIAADGLPNPERVAVIPNGIDVSFYENHADRESARREFGVTANEILVGTAGRLAWVKNQALFLQACAGVFARMPQIKAILVGDGPEEGNLRRLAKELGMGERVIFAGWRNDLPRCLSALDIFVLSSRSEVAPWVLLESMALGVPVISTNVGGVPEMVENGRTGLLVPTEDAQSLAQAILSLASFPTDRNQMAGRGKDFVKDHLTEDRMLRAISDMYLSAFRENPIAP